MPAGSEPRSLALAVVLAAGRGERFGDRTKQLALLDGAPLVAHPIRAAIEAGIRHLVVVVGHDGHAVAHAARDAAGDVPDIRSGHAGRGSGLRLWIVHNPEHERGQSTSLVAGIRAAGEVDAAEAAVILLADQPRVTADAIGAVADAVLNGAAVARASYVDGPSHPVGFARTRWPELLEVTGDAGARHLLRGPEVVEVAVDGPVPVDIDTPDDLLRAGA